jgi:sulfur-carrier protein
MRNARELAMKIVLSGNLRRYTSLEGAIQLDVTTLSEALDTLIERFPDLKPVLCDVAGNPRSVHRIYLNGELIDPNDFDQVLEQTDELGILTAIAGG